ncbi:MULTISPECIES: hypothetical protein [unclassified Bradyrhizobium]
MLMVPSVIAPVDHNTLINPAHPEFRHITTAVHEPVFWIAGFPPPSSGRERRMVRSQAIVGAYSASDL